MISYRTAQSYEEKFGRNVDASTGNWQVKKYLEYQVLIFLCILNIFNGIIF
jgi:homoserine acetyltransferase